MKVKRTRRTITSLKSPSAKSSCPRCPASLIACVVLFPICMWLFVLDAGQEESYSSLDTVSVSSVVNQEKRIPELKSCGKKGSRTLVMLMGEMECGEVAWESLYRHVLDVNCADLALLIPNKQAIQTPAPSLLKRAKYIWKYDDYNDWGEAWDTIDPDWRQKIEITPQAIEKGGWGGIHGNPGTGAKYNMLRYWLRENLVKKELVKQYDRYLLSTPGQYYVCDFDVSSLSPHWVWLPEGGGQLLLGSANHILDILDVIPTMLRHFKAIDQEWAKAYSAEQVLVAAYEAKQLPVDEIRRVFYGCEQSQGTESNPPPAREDQKLQFSQTQETCPKSGSAPETLEILEEEEAEEVNGEGEEEGDEEEGDDDEGDDEEGDDSEEEEEEEEDSAENQA